MDSRQFKKTSKVQIRVQPFVQRKATTIGRWLNIELNLNSIVKK